MSEGAPASVVSAAMNDLVGKELRVALSYPIGAQDIRKWALAVYFPEAPPARFLEGPSPLTAPEEFNPFAWATASSSRAPGPPDVTAGFIERQAGVEPPPLSNIVNGGVHCEYGVPMREGDVIRSASVVTGYTEKQGKRGLLLLTQLQDRWTNQDGAVVKTTTMTLIRF